MELYLNAGIGIWVFVTVIWVISLMIKDASIMDIFWGPGFILAGIIFYFSNDDPSITSKIIFLLVAVWGLRLAVHIGTRNAGHAEDERYARWRKNAGPSWWWRSYLKVFILQGVILWVITLPLFTSMSDTTDFAITLPFGVGFLLWLIGFLFEAIGDWQLSSFKKNGGTGVFDRGLWKYTRHPNYFGESLIWWGFWLMSISVGPLWTIVSPIFMTFLLLKVSGVAMLDDLLTETKPGYKEYISKTNAFIPGPPKK